VTINLLSWYDISCDFDESFLMTRFHSLAFAFAFALMFASADWAVFCAYVNFDADLCFICLSCVVCEICFFSSSSLSACSLWLWHCLDAVHMLDYMYLDQSRCFISFHWSITSIVCVNKRFQSNNFFLSCSHFLVSSCSFHFTLSFLIVIFLLQFKYFSRTLALRFFQSWW